MKKLATAILTIALTAAAMPTAFADFGIIDLQIESRGSDITISNSGTGARTSIYQYGDNARLNLNNASDGGHLIVFGNFCPPGARAEPIEHRGDHRLDIRVARCR